MTVSTTQNRKTYAGDGVSVVFAFPYKFLAASDLLVYLNGTLQTLTTHYSVGTPSDSGANVTFVTAPANGASVQVVSDPDQLQSAALPSTGPFPSVTVERMSDKLTLLVQRCRDLIGRSVRFPDSLATTADPTLPTPVAGAAIGWNSTGTALTNVTALSGALVSVAMTPVVQGVTLALGRAAFGSGATGDALFLAATAVAARSTLGLGSADTPSFAGLNGGQLAGLRNRVINGDMRVAQRGTSSALTTSYGYGCVDRWAAIMATSAAGTFGQFDFGAGVSGFKYGAYVQRTAASALTNALSVATALESINCIDLQGKTVTLSFYAQGGANFSGTNIVVQLFTGTGTDQSLATMASWTGTATPINATQVITTTLTRYSFTTTLGASISQIGIIFGYNPTGTAGASDFLNITGVQLELGSVATPFEQRPYGLELSLCQRYRFQMGGAVNSFQLRGYTAGGTSISQTIVFPAKMRTSPTVTIGSVTYSNASGLSFNTTPSHATMSISTTAIGDAYVTADASGIIAFDAEL